MRFGCLISLVILAIISSQNTVLTFFIRSYIPPGKTCNTTAGQECFTILFGKMTEVCSTDPLTFKCLHYNFLDQCFNRRVGYCESSQITTFARTGFQEVHKKCTKQNNKAYREVVPASIISRQFGDDKQRLSDPQVIATLGYLQTQCSIIQNATTVRRREGNEHVVAFQNTSCTSKGMEHVFDNCEHEIRSRSNPASNDFDRHKLLRIKLDTSRKLLSYLETEDRFECLMVRWALAEIFKIHQSHCFHSIMTRCLCERSEFDKRCNINCQGLELQPPPMNDDEWENLKESILRNHSGYHFYFNFLCLFSTLLSFICFENFLNFD